jgi:diadenylate cyclase
VIDFFANLFYNLVFIFERLTWLSVVDILLVTMIFFGILLLLRDTQAMVLFRGIILLVALMGILTNLEVLPAFSWLVNTTLPSLILVIPVIFAPEIRRALERLGRASIFRATDSSSVDMETTITAVVTACTRLAERKHGALIILQRLDTLDDYIHTGVLLQGCVTTELLMQIFYPNTPLHDGAVIISGETLVAASCVMPLSSSGVLTRLPERRMGLRHRAALGISEVSDAVAVVVSEETGVITVVHSGRMIRRLDSEHLDNILRAFYRPLRTQKSLFGLLRRSSPMVVEPSREDDKP